MFQMRVNCGISDLHGDAADHLPPLAEAGEAEAVPIAGAGVVTRPRRRRRWASCSCGSGGLPPGDRVHLGEGAGDEARFLSSIGAIGIGRGVFNPPRQGLALGDAVRRTGQPRSRRRWSVLRARSTRTPGSAGTRQWTRPSRPTLDGFGSPPGLAIGRFFDGRDRRDGRATAGRPGDRDRSTDGFRGDSGLRMGLADITFLGCDWPRVRDGDEVRQPSLPSSGETA